MPKQFYNIRAKTNDSAEILIYGDIGESWWGESVTAKEFVREVAALDVKNLTIRINSAGGSVSDGIAIYNAIKRHPANVTVVIDALAASAASLIAMAGDTVEMAENALLMIHAPWGGVAGNSANLREYADLLDTYAKAMSTSYATKTGRPQEEMLALLTDGIDHWYDSDSAISEKFIDAATPALALAASLDRAEISARFKSMPLKAQTNVAAATITPKEIQMPGSNNPAAAQETVAATQVDIAAVQAAALQADATRRSNIKALVTGNLVGTAGLDAVITAAADDVNCTLETAQQKVLAHLAKGVEPLAASHISNGSFNGADEMRKDIVSSLSVRAGLEKSSGNNQFRGYTLYELARASVERSGIKTSHLDKMGVVAAAFTHSSSDFTNLLADVANKSMLKGYEEADETFQLWTTAGELSDFKPNRRVDLNTFPLLDVVPEGAEYLYGTTGDRGETIQLATYGKMFGITRQAIINDDLSAFSKIPRAMGRAAIRTVGNLVYSVLTGNPNMSDGVALFHATHSNLAGTASVISTTSIDAMAAAMQKQKDPTGSTLNVKLGYVIVPVALRGLAMQVAQSEIEVGAVNKNNTTPNWVRGQFEVIADARLDTASTTSWYGAANPSMYDTIEVAYLDGNQAPTLEQQAGWGVDGVEFKVRLDAGVKALDYRTLAKNAGA
jgi:ATP-dependent protease ClpP protease subunit